MSFDGSVILGVGLVLARMLLGGDRDTHFLVS